MKFIVGLKNKMSQIFDENGNQIPITLIEAGPCFVTQIKTEEKNKYKAVQIGFIKKTKRIKKTEKGKEFRFLKEFKDGEQLKVGDEINVSIFEVGDVVKVSGVSKGKGFQGVVKRWGFHGRPATHGTKHEERTGGSTGSSAPSRVVRGRKMAGHMGVDRVTVRNLKIVRIDKENNLLAIRGAVPGRKGTLLEIKE